MVVDAQSRHELHRRLEEVLGAEAAATLIEYLPPVGWADVATKADPASLEQRMDLRFERVDETVRASASDLRASFEHEMRAQSATLEHGLRTQTTTMVFGLMGVVLTMAALAFALVRFT